MPRQYFYLVSIFLKTKTGVLYILYGYLMFYIDVHSLCIVFDSSCCRTSTFVVSGSPVCYFLDTFIFICAYKMQSLHS